MMFQRGWRLLPLILIAGCNKTASLPDTPTDDPSVRTTTDFNSPSTPQEMATKCDVPYYPGSEAPTGMSRMPRKDTDGNTHYELVLTTHDSPKKVGDYYSKVLSMTPTQNDGNVSIVGKSPHKNDLLIEVVKEGGQTMIRIHSIAYKSA